MQYFCDSHGKLTVKENTLKQTILYGLQNALHENDHKKLYKIWQFAQNISVLKNPEWHAAWNKVLLQMHTKLSQIGFILEFFGSDYSLSESFFSTY